MSHDVFSVFYAWQSDTPSSENRNFIEAAAKKALHAVDASGRLELPMRLDSDTKNTPGLPSIVETIYKKIDSSSVFLADVTFVAETKTKAGKELHLPNSNVMIELGYAFRSLGPERIVLVQNEHFGKAEKLPFDLRHRRWPLRYELRPTLSALHVRKAEADLHRELSKAIMLIAEMGPRHDAQGAVKRMRQYLNDLMDEVALGNFRSLKSEQPTVIMSLQPLEPPDVLLVLGDCEDRVSKKLHPLYCRGYGQLGYSGDAIETWFPASGRVTSAARITVDGAVDTVCSTIGDSRNQIPSVTLEEGIVESICKYLELFKELRIRGPYILGIAIINSRDTSLAISPRYSSGNRQCHKFQILPPPVTVPSKTDPSDFQKVAMALRPTFDFVWREYGQPRSANYTDTDGQWVGQC